MNLDEELRAKVLTLCSVFFVKVITCKLGALHIKIIIVADLGIPLYENKRISAHLNAGYTAGMYAAAGICIR